MERFEKAMKSEEFRKIFTEYAKEISDPENRKVFNYNMIVKANWIEYSLEYSNSPPWK